MIITSQQSAIRDVGYIKMYNYVTKMDSQTISITMGLLDGDYPETTSETNDRAFYVVAGQGMFTVAGETSLVRPDDVAYVPRGTAYSISGKMKLLIVNSPPFGV